MSVLDMLAVVISLLALLALLIAAVRFGQSLEKRGKD